MIDKVTREQLSDFSVTLLKDYDIDPTSWTGMEIDNLVNLLAIYNATRKYPVKPQGDI